MKLLKKLAALSLCAGLAWGSAALAADAPKDLVLRGDAKCTKCHDESDSPKLLAIGKTKHGTKADGRTPTCVSCHGDSDKHVGYKGKDAPPKPDVFFGKTASADLKNSACTSCHQGGKHMNWNLSAHASNDVACTSCHNVHAGQDKVRDKRQQADVCYTCHKQQRADANKPSHHPIPEGKMTCSDCHNTHGSTGEKMLIKDTTNATCFTCHAEKRGPFVHNHQPVVEDCSNCHNPHGTTAENMLKSRLPFLCQSCHGTEPHPGNVPSSRVNMPNAASNNIGPGMAQARGCSNCHTNIHGSNNPANASSAGPARFWR